MFWLNYKPCGSILAAKIKRDFCVLALSYNLFNTQKLASQLLEPGGGGLVSIDIRYELMPVMEALCCFLISFFETPMYFFHRNDVVA